MRLAATGEPTLTPIDDDRLQRVCKNACGLPAERLLQAASLELAFGRNALGTDVRARATQANRSPCSLCFLISSLIHCGFLARRLSIQHGFSRTASAAQDG